jgi:hypothetical protein
MVRELPLLKIFCAIRLIAVTGFIRHAPFWC